MQEIQKIFIPNGTVLWRLFCWSREQAAFKLQGTNFGFMLFDIDKSKVGFDNISDECFKVIKTVFKKYYRSRDGES